jgi:hypothetical protein
MSAVANGGYDPLVVCMDYLVQQDVEIVEHLPVLT